MRNSSRSKSFQGVNAKLTLQGNKLVNTFTNGDGSQFTTSADSFLLDATVPASIKSIDFGVVKSYFTTRGSSEKYATAVTLLLLDAAKIQGISPVSLLQNIDKSSISINDSIAYIMNLLDESTSRLTTAKLKSNNLSFKSQYIRV
jgi:hypothetical protein